MTYRGNPCSPTATPNPIPLLLGKTQPGTLTLPPIPHNPNPTPRIGLIQTFTMQTGSPQTHRK